MEVTLDRLSLDIVLDRLGNVSHVLRTALLDHADDTDDRDYGDKDNHAKYQVSAAVVYGAGRLLDNDLLHLGHNLALLIECHNLLGAVLVRHNFRCCFVCVLVFVLVVGLVLHFLLKHAFFELIPVEVRGLLLLVGREDRYAFDFGVEDARLHHVRFVLDEVAIV